MRSKSKDEETGGSRERRQKYRKKGVVKKQNSTPIPGRVIRQNTQDSDTDENSKQFLKLDVKYITDGEVRCWSQGVHLCQSTPFLPLAPSLPPRTPLSQDSLFSWKKFFSSFVIKSLFCDLFGGFMHKLWHFVCHIFCCCMNEWHYSPVLLLHINLANVAVSEREIGNLVTKNSSKGCLFHRLDVWYVLVIY